MSWSTLVAIPLWVVVWPLVWVPVRDRRLRGFADPTRVDALSERERRGLRFNAQGLLGTARLLGPLGRPACRTASQILAVLGDRGRPSPDARLRRWGPAVLVVALLVGAAAVAALLGAGPVRTVALWVLYVSLPVLVATGAWTQLRNADDEDSHPETVRSSDA